MNPAIDKIYRVDDYQLGKVHRPSETISSPGGKGLNVARVANLMGEQVMASGLLGGGNGAFIEKHVETQGILSRFGKIAGESRICINVTDTLSQQCTEVLEEGPLISTEEGESFLQNFADLMPLVNVITISGSLPRGLSSGYYRKLIEIAKTNNKKVLLDTSGLALLEGIEARPYLVKPNQDEMLHIFKQSTSIVDYVKGITYLKSKGIELPIISKGKDGSIAGLSDGIYRVTIPPVKVVNTVGSGDSFIAGCAVALEWGLSQIDLLKLGTACGTTNTQFTQTGYVEKDRVEDYFNQVTVEKIADY